MSKNETCETCVFFRKENIHEGTCRRYPPVFDKTWIEIYGDDDIDGAACESSIWWSQPVVASSDWCGEFKNAL